jgi:3-deoxy-manno-octulosonate cytidylyltransferase (CMP-KDO synthetase)
MNILGIIPARYGSSRFPGKPLADINGRSMILRVCSQASQSGSLCEVVVATDDRRIFDHVIAGGYRAVMTSGEHPSGTDRCREALQIWNQTALEPADAVINIQGDEPFIHPEQIDELAVLLHQDQVSIATLARLIRRREEIFSPDIVKVVFDGQNNALFFSRSPLPYLRGVGDTAWMQKKAHFKHIGIYGYRSAALTEICRLPVGRLEKCESLEQLRWLENGFHIRVGLTEYESFAIDTPEDLLKITNIA